MRIDILIIFSLLFTTPSVKSLDNRTYVSLWLSVLIIVVTGIVSLLLRYFYAKEKPKFNWEETPVHMLVDFFGKGMIVVWLFFAINFYFRADDSITVNKKVEDNFKKGPKGDRFVIISNPSKMINIGEDYTEYGSIDLTLSRGLLGFDIIEHYELRR